VLRRSTALLTSPKLAIALLVVVLACCVAGVTIFRGEHAGVLIFSTLWFNALLVLLAVSSATAFFSRIWKRKLTLVSGGMIVFHLSFAAMLGGIVYNRLFFFDGMLRLTEGETLPNDRPDSYDLMDHGRFFDLSRMRGKTTLVRMHRNYKIDGGNKRAAYEIAVGEGRQPQRSIIYITEYLDVGGIRYFCAKEGYSVLVVVSEKGGQEIYGAYVPLQSLKQPDGRFVYAAGTASGPATFGLPPPPAPPRAQMLLTLRPNTVEDRQGEVTFAARSIARDGTPGAERKGSMVIGAPFDLGDVTLTPREIRYWVGINVRYDPGLAIILTSLCLGLAGIIVMFVGRLRQGMPQGATRGAGAPQA
jgi:cytochrome c biogenesis protein ResB